MEKLKYKYLKAVQSYFPPPALTKVEFLPGSLDALDTCATCVTGHIVFIVLCNAGLLCLTFLSFSFQCPLQAWWERPPDLLGAQQREHIFPPSHRGNHDNS